MDNTLFERINGGGDNMDNKLFERINGGGMCVMYILSNRAHIHTLPPRSEEVCDVYEEWAVGMNKCECVHDSRECVMGELYTNHCPP